MNPKIFDKYTKIRVIGTGIASIVYLVTFYDEEELKTYALKAVNKEKLVKLKQISQISNEKNLHFLLNHPFIIKL